MGLVNFPTGKILAVDPLVYLDRSADPYFTTVPTGIFPLTAAVVEEQENHYRYAAVKVDFNNEQAIYYIEALHSDEDLSELEEAYSGFCVDAGLGTIVDIEARDAYCDFIEAWEKKNPDYNAYDSFFSEEFKNSQKKFPRFQKQDGDWINFPLPGTELSVPMFQSGFGDGFYPVYFGYDGEGRVCRVVVQFIDIALSYPEKK
jgi:hypothetical protein